MRFDKQFTARILVSAAMTASLAAAAGSVLAGSEDPAPAAKKDKEEDPRRNAAAINDRVASLEETIRLLEAHIHEMEARSPAQVITTSATQLSLPAENGSGEAATRAETNPDPAAAPVAVLQTANKESFFDKVSFGGLVDTYYGFNFNRPPSQTNALRNFDVNHNQFSLNLLELAMERKADPFGFRVDLDFGDAAKLVAASEPGGTSLYQFLQQAYFTYKAPVGKGLVIDFGKFVTPFGAEVIETPANYNYSRSLLFAWAIPYYHFGARVSYPINDKVALTGMVVNGWNDVVDNNGGKSVHFGVNLTPFKQLNIVQNYMIGPEQPGNNRDKRQVLDTVVTLAASDKLSLMANYDYGMDRVAGIRSRYQGLAGYARYAFSSRFAISPRVEWFADPQGLATGFAQTLREGTLTSEFKLRPSMLLRAEFRRDWSDRPYFQTRSSLLAHSQNTATLGILYIMGQEP
jgi:hypothetical protein